MGNHVVGKMFNSGVSFLTEKEIDDLSQEKAFEIINSIGKKVINSTSLDAEFDDYANPNKKLGKVLIKAFFPEKYNDWKEKEYVTEEMDEDWYNNVWKPFTKLFGFW